MKQDKELSSFSPCINVNVCQQEIFYTLLQKFLENILMGWSLIKTFFTISVCFQRVQVTLKNDVWNHCYFNLHDTNKRLKFFIFE